MKSDELFMNRCLQLAENGIGKVESNPYVGAVVVHNGKIIGEGFHKQFGGPHAEVNAINSVKNKSLLPESTIYVNLEPCSHHGKTPPCTDLIIKSGIKNVVIGMQDPNEIVAGTGIKKLQSAGINVIIGILEQQSKWLNRRFIIFHTKKRPYVILKWAKSKDGFIDIDRSQKSAAAMDNWITGHELKILVHKWRAQEQAILIGYNTLINDNPYLNVRHWQGRNPLRVLISDIIPEEHFNVFSDDQKTLVFNPVKEFTTNKAEYIKLDFNNKLIENVLNVLFKKNINSVIVEGGQMVLNSFIKSNLWDEARLLTGNKVFKTGLKSPEVPNAIETEQSEFGNDIMQDFINGSAQ